MVNTTKYMKGKNEARLTNRRYRKMAEPRKAIQSQTDNCQCKTRVKKNRMRNESTQQAIASFRHTEKWNLQKLKPKEEEAEKRTRTRKRKKNQEQEKEQAKKRTTRRKKKKKEEKEEEEEEEEEEGEEERQEKEGSECTMHAAACDV